MHFTALISVAAICVLVSPGAAVLTPTSNKNNEAAVDAPDTSPLVSALVKGKCTGYCTNHTTCGLEDGCCCSGKFNFCFTPRKGETCKFPV
ncbi:hypothetical protein FB451DRAFT_1288733 [Mycena latifolia]|nr:hypothetical protein FB451DRAFT_1288733 [Mycena latifolia]